MEAKRQVMVRLGVGVLGIWGLIAAGAGSPSVAGEGRKEPRTAAPNVRDTWRHQQPVPEPVESTTPPPVLFLVSPDKESPPEAYTGADRPSQVGAKVDANDRPPNAAKLGVPAPARERFRKAWSATSSEPPADLAPSPALISGPLLQERGRIGAMTLSDFHAGIQDAALDPSVLIEQPVQPAPLEIDRPKRREYIGLISQAALDQQLRQQLPSLNACRVEIARQQALAWSAVAAGRVTLQWTILPTGGVSKASVVAIDPLDPYVQDCVLRRMRQWTFVRPSGSTVPMSRSFEFR